MLVFTSFWTFYASQVMKSKGVIQKSVQVQTIHISYIYCLFTLLGTNLHKSFGSKVPSSFCFVCVSIEKLCNGVTNDNGQAHLAPSIPNVGEGNEDHLILSQTSANKQ